MRRALAAAILGISLWVGSLAWSGFIMSRTVLDPGRSRDIADSLYDNEAVRSQLVDNIADALERALPPELGVPRPVIENAAAQALTSPAVKAVVVDAFVATHAAFLGEGEAPESIDAGAFGSAARDALVAARPELDAVLPAAPSLLVELPTDRIPNLGPVRRVIDSAVPVLALLAAVGSLLALGLTPNRPAILRRAGFWAVGLSAAVLAFAYGIPALAERFAPDQSQIVAALVGAMAAATRGPAVALAAAGVAGIATSLVWNVAPGAAGVTSGLFSGSASGAAASPPPPGGAAPRTPRVPRRDIPTPMHRRPPSPDPSRPARRPDPDGFSRRHPVPPPDPHPGYPASKPPPSPGAPSAAAPTRSTDRPPATRWVEGVGWVLESTEAIPEDARWVPGVGYVVDS